MLIFICVGTASLKCSYEVTFCMNIINNYCSDISLCKTCDFIEMSSLFSSM